MTDDDRDLPHEFPDLRMGEGDDDSPSRRKPQPYRASPAALIVAVILGTGLALGIVALIPQGWKDRVVRGKTTARKTPDGATRGTDNEPADRHAGDSRPKKSRPQPNAPPDSKSQDPATKIATRLEREAAGSLVKARRLIAARNPKQACKILEDIMNRYPSTKAAVEAERLLLKTAM